MKSFREQREDKRNNAAPQGAPADAAKSVEDLAKMNEGDLTSLLMQEAARAKADGTLNADTLRTFYDQMAPMLTPEQRDKMKALLSMIAP